MPVNRRHFSIATSVALAGSSALAQVPARTIRLVLGFPAGSGGDVMARLVAEQMSRQLGQPIIVDNRPGGEGIISADFVAKSPPDGSTIYVGSSNSLIGTPILRGPSVVPYDPFKDFTPITQLGLFTMVWVVAPSMPGNLADFVAYVRARPGQLNYAGTNTTTRLAALQVLSQYKLDMLHVPYKGEPPAQADLMANRVHMMATTVAGARAFVKDGRMKALMVQRGSRTPLLPDVPTTTEAGANVRISPWMGLYGPPNMPTAVLERYNQAYRAAASSKELQDRFEQLAFEAVPTTPQGMGAIHRSEYEVFRKAVQEDGIKFD